MATYRIRPCARLSGEITVHSAKNAVLPLMCGALLTRETVIIEQIPALTDVKTLTDILRDCGVLMHADQAEKLLTMTADSPRSPRREDLLSRMRASVLVIGRCWRGRAMRGLRCPVAAQLVSVRLICT